MNSLRKVLTHQEDNDEEAHILGHLRNNDSLCPSLSWETRIRGFICCLVIGIVLSLLGTIMLFFYDTVAFALLYSMGTIVALASSMFLRGPVSQVKSMCKEKRIVATIMMLAMVALTLMAALWWQNAVLSILFCIMQYLAFGWYSISYIPFARDAVKNCCASVVA